NRTSEIQPPVDECAVDSGIHRVQQELFSVHGASTLIGGEDGGAHPFEVANLVAAYAGMNVGGLRSEGRTHFAGSNGLCQVIRGRGSECLVDVRKMLAIEFVKVAVVGRVMLGAVPPVPVAALGNHDFFEGQLALRLAGASGVLRIKFARVVQIVPGSIVFGSANPDVEV